MRWLERELWKAGITIAGMMLILVFMVWIPVSAASADDGASGFAGPGTATVQGTPTVDATVAALNKEKLQRDLDQQQHTLENWFWNNGAALISSLVLGIAGAFTLLRYLRDQRNERDKQRNEREKQRDDRQAELEKRAEERFQAAVTGLGDEKESAKIGAAILLRTFLRPGYEQFYTQTFDLAVANLRLPRSSGQQEDTNTPLSLNTLRKALTVVFKEAFPLARSQNEERPQSLDAMGIQLDKAYLWKADLKQAWIPLASLRDAFISGADLSEAYLYDTDLSGADLSGTDLSGAKLRGAKLRGAKLRGAKFRGADLSSGYRGNEFIRTDLSRANLYRVDLSEANLSGVDLSEANLSGANLSEANLSGANLSGANLSGVNLEGAVSLKDTKLLWAKGLTRKQLEACKAKGAIIDEDLTTNSSQSTVAPPPPSQSNNAQAPSTPSAQGSTQIPDAGESSTASSGPGSQS